MLCRECSGSGRVASGGPTPPAPWPGGETRTPAGPLHHAMAPHLGTYDPATQDPTTQDPTTQDHTTQDPTTQDHTTQDHTTQDHTTRGTWKVGTTTPLLEPSMDPDTVSTWTRRASELPQHGQKSDFDPGKRDLADVHPEVAGGVPLQVQGVPHPGVPVALGPWSAHSSPWTPS